MRKKYKVFLVLILLVLAVSIVFKNYAIALTDVSNEALVGKMNANSKDYEYHLITPESGFQSDGWTIEKNSYAFNNRVLKCIDNNNNANISIGGLKKNTEYYLWIRSVDFPYNNPGTRSININDCSEEFGQHSENYKEENGDSEVQVFWWESYKKIRENNDKKNNVISNDKGELNFYINGQPYARFDAIIITDDPEFEPSNVVMDKDEEGQYKYQYDYTPITNIKNTENIQALYNELLNFCDVEKMEPFKEELKFPSYAQKEEENCDYGYEFYDDGYTISNEHINLTFRKQQSSENGKNYIQKQTKIKIKKNGQEYTTEEYTDGLGWLCLYQDEAEKLENVSTPTFSYKGKNKDNKGIIYITKNSFEAGYPSWIIPSSIEKTNDNTIKVTGYNDYASMAVTYTLENEDYEPIVKVQFTVKKPGNYSFGMFNSNKEIDRDDVKFIQVPYRYQEKAIPDLPVMVTEAYSTSALSQMTFTNNNKDITYGIVVDPSKIENRWAYNTDDSSTEEQSNFGLTIVGQNLGVKPGLFAPIMGSADSKLETGKVFEFIYRPTTTISDVSTSSWYENYEHIIKDILKVEDYRKNYNASMTDTIFNMYKLLLDDDASGWSEEGKANYNMEGRNIVSNADALEYLQMYLLTEDENIYKRRTIPTLEYILSRKNATFAINDITNSSSAFINMFKTGVYSGMGLSTTSGTSGMGNSTYIGAYLMTLGKMPQLRNISASNEVLGTYIAQATELDIKNPSEYLWLYKTTNETKYLDLAMEKADIYIKNRVDYPWNKIANDSDFIYKTYFPNFNCLLEMYECLKDRPEDKYKKEASKYLNAAKESARRLITTLWSTSTPKKAETIELKNNFKNAENSQDVKGKYYRGNEQIRLGYENLTVLKEDSKTKLENYEETEVPAWVVSRNGIGLEQTSTFTKKSKNIIMSTWAPDLMRLAELLEEQGQSQDGKIFEVYARNSIVGRFSNYPGYYQNEYNIYSLLEDYPYEGPDTTNIYYHHIPVLLATLEDFLFSQSYNWSNGLINFENTRSQGYQWFSNRHYGYTSGTVFGEEDMWLWLKEGLLTVGNDNDNDEEKEKSKQIDWYAARKDGRVVFVLMNESDECIQEKEITFNSELGIKGDATIYSLNDKGEIVIKNEDINNNKITQTIEAKSIIAIAMDAENVKKPNYANNKVEDIEYDGETTSLGVTKQQYNIIPQEDGSIPDKKEGKTYDVNSNIIQIDPDKYYLHIYSDRKPYSYTENGEDKTNADGIKAMELTYQIEGEEKITQTDSTYPFEFSIEVNDSSKTISYEVKFVMGDNIEYDNGGKNIQTMNPYEIETIDIEIEKGQEYDLTTLSNTIINTKINKNSSYIDLKDNKITAKSAGTCSVLMVNGEKTNIVNITVKEDVAEYVVKHYTIGLDGTTKTLVGTDNLEGKIGETVEPEVKQYTGFKSPNKKQVEIKADGSTEVEYLYTREQYTVVYNGNSETSGTMTNNVYTYGETKKLQKNSFEKQGYKFKGWSTSLNGKIVYQNEQEVTIDKNMVLYAVWEKEITGGNTEEGTGENTGGNTEEGTGENTGGNTEEGTGENTGGNTEEGTGENTGENTEEGTGENTEENKIVSIIKSIKGNKDETQSPNKIPQTGVTLIAEIVIFCGMILTIVYFIKYKLIKNRLKGKR